MNPGRNGRRAVQCGGCCRLAPPREPAPRSRPMAGAVARADGWRHSPVLGWVCESCASWAAPAARRGHVLPGGTGRPRRPRVKIKRNPLQLSLGGAPGRISINWEAVAKLAAPRPDAGPAPP